MPHKLRLTPLQRDFLWMLEEAGAESLPTIVATIKPLDATSLGREIDGLLSRALVNFYRDLNRPNENYVELTATEIDDLPSTAELLGQPDLELVTGLMLTKIGRSALAT